MQKVDEDSKVIFELLERERQVSNSSYTLHPAPYTLHPTPYTLHPTPYTLHPKPYTLHPQPLPH